MKKNIETEISRIMAADVDLKVAYQLPPDAEIQFAGAPILALNPATNNLTVPSRFLRHPLVQDRYFCTLPQDFWRPVYDGVGQNRFDPELVELETTLSGMCGDHSRYAGFKNGRAFSFPLRQRPMQLSSEAAQAAAIDRNQAQLDHIARTAEERSAAVTKTTRAYTGWLLTNPQFLGELDELLKTWAVMVRRWGFDRLGIVLPKSGLIPGDDPTADERWAGYSFAFEQFFARWRLRGMAAPYLPVPLEPLMAGRFPVSVLHQIMNSGGAFVLPDIYPIPSRDQLRALLEDALHRSTAPDHLDEWRKLIASDNTAKKPFVRYARLFEVQHYYRNLQQRHARALGGELASVKAALASFLGAAARTINDDLKFLNRRLGRDWVERGRDF